MIYFDNSASSFYKPPCVINAVKNALEFLPANPGRSGHVAAVRGAALVQKTRDRLCTLLGCNQIIFTDSCTGAINLALLGSAKRGHVVTTAFEHNSVLRTLYALKKSGVITLSVVYPQDSGVLSVESVKNAVKKDTFLVAVNHVSNVTGAIAPIAEIGEFCRSRGIRFFVDGAQSVGYSSVDMKKMNVDLLSVAPHKGLHSPQGVGVLAINGDVTLSPVRYGGTGTASHELSQPDDIPEGFEAGTLPLPAIAGLCAATFWYEKNAEDNAEKLFYLSRYLREGLTSLGVELYSPDTAANGIICFNLPNVFSSTVSNVLSSQYGVCVRSGLHCAPLIHEHLGTLKRGAVRVSMGCDNTEEEVEFFIKAVKNIMLTSSK